MRKCSPKTKCFSPKESLLLHVLSVAFTSSQPSFRILPKQLKTNFGRRNIWDFFWISEPREHFIELTLLIIAIASNERNLG